MALKIQPEDGVFIRKSVGVDEETDIVRTFKVTNDGTDVMYIRHPNLTGLRGVVIESDGDQIGRTADIQPGASTNIVIRVRKEYINSFDDVTLDQQFLDFTAYGYAPEIPDEPDEPTDPTEPDVPTIRHYGLFILPVDSTYEFNDGTALIPIHQERFLASVRLIAYLDDGTRRIVWPDGGFSFTGNESLDRTQMRLIRSERSEQSENVWVVEFQNDIGGLLDANWTARVRDSKYLDQAGRPAFDTINFKGPGGPAILDDPEPDDPRIDPPSTRNGGGGGSGERDTESATRLDTEIL